MMAAALPRSSDVFPRLGAALLAALLQVGLLAAAEPSDEGPEAKPESTVPVAQEGAAQREVAGRPATRAQRSPSVESQLAPSAGKLAVVVGSVVAGVMVLALLTLLAVSRRRSAATLKDGAESPPPVNRESTIPTGACPKCGFTYGWNGQSCSHCGHVGDSRVARDEQEVVPIAFANKTDCVISQPSGWGEGIQEVLAKELLQAKKKRLRPFVYFHDNRCAACNALVESLTNPSMSEAFARTYVIMLSAIVWRAAAKRIGFDVDVVPVFFRITDKGLPIGKISGAAWEQDTPENMSGPLKEFLQAKVVQFRGVEEVAVELPAFDPRVELSENVVRYYASFRAAHLLDRLSPISHKLARRLFGSLGIRDTVEFANPYEAYDSEKCRAFCLRLAADEDLRRRLRRTADTFAPGAGEEMDRMNREVRAVTVWCLTIGASSRGPHALWVPGCPLTACKRDDGSLLASFEGDEGSNLPYVISALGRDRKCR